MQPSWADTSRCAVPLTIAALRLGEQTGRKAIFNDRTGGGQAYFEELGGGSESLLKVLASEKLMRQSAREADVIVIATGPNELGIAYEPAKSGTCGGKDDKACFRKLGRLWNENFDAILREIETLRAGKPTAGRLVDAAKHHAVCVDVRPIINGRSLDQPGDENSPESMRAVAEALLATKVPELAAHRRGLVHRDVKPGNILIDEDGHAYLTDFGITKRVGAASTDTGHVLGTLDYLAPEQIRGEPIDGRTDCYALACVLYECVAGAPPFHRDTEAETMWAHLQESPPPLPGYPALDPVLPGSGRVALRRCLAQASARVA